MDVQYKHKYLEKCYKKRVEAIKRWGTDIGAKYKKQLDLVYASETVQDLYHIPQLRFHPLKGNRKEQYSITLTGRARLIAELKGNTLFIVMEVNTEHYE